MKMNRRRKETAMEVKQIWKDIGKKQRKRAREERERLDRQRKKATGKDRCKQRPESIGM